MPSKGSGAFLPNWPAIAPASTPMTPSRIGALGATTGTRLTVTEGTCGRGAAVVGRPALLAPPAGADGGSVGALGAAGMGSGLAGVPSGALDAVPPDRVWSEVAGAPL